MASTNPWAKKKARTLRYDSPKQKPDPFSRFSVAPGALAVRNSFMARLREQGKIEEGQKIPAAYRNDFWVELAPFIETPGLEGMKDEKSARVYRQRARDNQMLTVDEANDLVDHSIDYVTSVPVDERSLQTKDPSELVKEYIDEQKKTFESLPDNAVLIPFLVNVSWHFDESKTSSGGRKSPRAKYSIEGTFYATDEQDAIAIGQQFINTYVLASVTGPGSHLIDLSNEGPQGVANAEQAIGSQRIDGPSVTKKQAEDMEFDPNFRAFFTRKSGKTSDDQNFKDPYYRCRIVKGQYVI